MRGTCAHQLRPKEEDIFGNTYNANNQHVLGTYCVPGPDLMLAGHQQKAVSIPPAPATSNHRPQPKTSGNPPVVEQRGFLALCEERGRMHSPGNCGASQ